MKRWRTEGFTQRCLVAATLCCGCTVVVPSPPGFAEIANADRARTFSAEKLRRSIGLSRHGRDEISSGEIPGAVVLVQQHGKPVYFECSACGTPTPAIR